MKTQMPILRLQQANWKPSMITLTHYLYYKQRWQCAVNRKNGTMTFTRLDMSRRDRINLMRGEIEEGIE